MIAYNCKNEYFLNFAQKLLQKLLTNRFFCVTIVKRKSKAELCNGSTADSDSVRLGSNPGSAAKKSSFFGTRIFLSKPQAWYIISPFGAVSHHAPACIYLRLDDIQGYALICLQKCDIINSPINKNLSNCQRMLIGNI